MSYKVKCSKCGNINKVRKNRNLPTYHEKCSNCGAISDTKSEVFLRHSKDSAVSFELVNP